MDIKPNILPASAITGKRVENFAGKYIGGIQNIIIEPAAGNVVYAVLSFGGFPGIGDKFFAIPVQALEFSAKEKTIALDISKEKLENAPGFNKGNLPLAANLKFIESVYNHNDLK